MTALFLGERSLCQFLILLKSPLTIFVSTAVVNLSDLEDSNSHLTTDQGQLMFTCHNFTISEAVMVQSKCRLITPTSWLWDRTAPCFIGLESTQKTPNPNSAQPPPFSTRVPGQRNIFNNKIYPKDCGIAQ